MALLAAIRPHLTGEVITPKDAERIIRIIRMAPRSGVDKSGAKELARRLFERIDGFNARDVARSIGIRAPELESKTGDRWRAEYTQKILDIDDSARERITGYLRRVGETGWRVEHLRDRLEKAEGFSERAARRTARDAVLTLNARLSKERHLAAGITEYEWLCTRDGSSVHLRRGLDGKRFKYSEPPMGGGTRSDERGHPGDGDGCRCQQIPVVPEFADL